MKSFTEQSCKHVINMKMACQQSVSGFHLGATEVLNVQHELIALPV